MKFYILNHKKHKRKIYFRDTPEAIKFIKPKFKHSLAKKFLYLLIKLRLHKLFCKTIDLPEEMGDVVYIANSVKSFDLKNEWAYTFIGGLGDLIKKVNEQRSIEQFAPKVLKVDIFNMCVREELLYDKKLNPVDIYNKLHSSHKFTNNKFIHGDFVPDHVKVDKEGNIKFIDWMIRRGKPSEDFDNYILNGIQR